MKNSKLEITLKVIVTDGDITIYDGDFYRSISANEKILLKDYLESIINKHCGSLISIVEVLKY